MSVFKNVPIWNNDTMQSYIDIWTFNARLANIYEKTEKHIVLVKKHENVLRVNYHYLLFQEKTL